MWVCWVWKIDRSSHLRQLLCSDLSEQADVIFSHLLPFPPFPPLISSDYHCNPTQPFPALGLGSQIFSCVQCLLQMLLMWSCCCFRYPGVLQWEQWIGVVTAHKGPHQPWYPRCPYQGHVSSEQCILGVTSGMCPTCPAWADITTCSARYTFKHWNITAATVHL